MTVDSRPGPAKENSGPAKERPGPARERQWAVITGASAGLGADFARQLAERGWHLVLVARRLDRLQALADEIRNAHRDLEIEVIALDLALPDAATTLLERTTTRGRNVQALVNNAGFGTYGPFEDLDWPRQQEMLTLNILRLTELCWQFARHMRTHGLPSHILNVGSIAAFQPTPFFAAYGATKAYVRNFSESLAWELRDSAIRVSCLSPGATRTEFSDVAGIDIPAFADRTQMTSPDVVRRGVVGMLAGQTQIVPGFINHLTVLLSRLAPRSVLAWGAVQAMGGRAAMRRVRTDTPTTTRGES
jgi:short-subunit dehydrogenase